MLLFQKWTDKEREKLVQKLRQNKVKSFFDDANDDEDNKEEWDDGRDQTSPVNKTTDRDADDELTEKYITPKIQGEPYS